MITQQLQHKIDNKTKPLGSLGSLEGIAIKIGQIQNTLTPELKKPTIFVFAADHGLADEGVSPFPKDVTWQMVMNFLHGGAAINVFCRQHNIDLKVVDAGVDYTFEPNTNLINAKIMPGTRNILKAPAMTIDECMTAMNKGAEIIEQQFAAGCNIIGFGEMGIGNTSAAALLMNKYTRTPIEECVGKGTGHNSEGMKKKTAILKQASSLYPEINDPLQILATFGGLEIAMITGAMLQAHSKKMIILVDGFIVTSALLAAQALEKRVLDSCVFCHQSDESGHVAMLKYLGAKPILNLGMRLGEGTGAAVAYPIIDSAVRFLNEMASFESAGVANKE